MKVAVINYGLGNLGSVRRALEDLGVDAFVADHPGSLFDAERMVLPGVGAFAEGMRRLISGGWLEAIRQQVAGGKPLLGICLGMQMLAQGGDEGGEAAGLGLVPGRVVHLESLGCRERIPHVGWNEVSHRSGDPLFARVPQGTDFYFVHSYAVAKAGPEVVSGEVTYGIAVTAAVRSGNVFGVQFHPEKSSRAGRQVLRNFLDWRPC